MLKKIIENIDESAVGKRGRTGKIDAQEFVDSNPALIKEFSRIVTKMGGKAVASAILNTKSVLPMKNEKNTYPPEVFSEKADELHQALSKMDRLEVQKLQIAILDRERTNHDGSWQADYFYGAGKKQSKVHSKLIVDAMIKYLPKGTTEKQFATYFLNGVDPKKYFAGIKAGEK